jgi:hypothetical protein
MKREDVLKEMKESIGTKDPLVFFAKMVDVLTLLFDRLDQMENQLDQVKTQSALAIYWEPRLASDMLAKQVATLRQADKDTYTFEISELKKAYAEDKVTQSYLLFTEFWLNTLGWHPFLDQA